MGGIFGLQARLRGIDRAGTLFNVASGRSREENHQTCGRLARFAPRDYSQI